MLPRVNSSTDKGHGSQPTLEELKGALRRTERRYGRLTENTRCAIFQVTSEGRLISANRALVGMLRYESQEELMAADLAEVFQNRGDFTEFLQEIEAGIRRLKHLRVWRCRDGSTIGVRLWGRPVWGKNRKLRYIAGVAEDVTALELARRFRDMVDDWQGQLDDVMRQTIPVLGHSELLSLQGNLGEESQKDLEGILRAAQAVLSARRKVEDLYRRDLWKPVPVSLNKLVCELEEFFRPFLPAKVQWVSQLDPEVRAVLADPGQLTMMAINLVNHACAVMPISGTLTARTHSLSIDPAQGTKISLAPGRYYVLSVSDTSRSIRSDGPAGRLAAHITSTQTSVKGSKLGQGLTLIDQLSQQSRGRVQWQYFLGENTMFEIILPVCREAPALEARPRSSESSGWDVGGAILVLEEGDETTEFATEFLKSGGYEVLHASTSEKAVESVQQHGKPICLIVAAVGHAQEVERTVVPCLAAQPFQPRLLYTDLNAKSERRATEKGAAFLQKPYLRSELLSKVAEALEVPAPDHLASAKINGHDQR